MKISELRVWLVSTDGTVKLSETPVVAPVVEVPLGDVPVSEVPMPNISGFVAVVAEGALK
jgi:hypothetical protein